MEEEAGPGFSIIGVVSQSKETEKPVFPMDDPIADDYTRWQLISILSILLGGVLAYLSASAVIADLDPINPFDSVSNIRYALEVIGGFLSITFLAGGIFGFRRIGRAIKRYEEEILGISE